MAHEPVPSLAAPTPAEQAPPSTRSSLLKLAWPVIAEQVLATLANLVDMILVGRLGAVAIAAVGLSLQPLWMTLSIFLGIGTGVNALVSRAFGANDQEAVRKGSHTAFWLGLFFAGLVGALVWVLTPSVISLMGAQADTAGDAATYLRVLVPGLVGLYWSMVLNAALRAVGDTRTSFYVNVMVNVINLVLSWALIYGHLGMPALGVYGAGLATTIARLLGAVVFLAVAWQRFGGFGSFDWTIMTRMLQVGVPAALEKMSSTLFYLIFARIISDLGTVAFAAHHVAVTGENIVWTATSGLSTATAVLVGQSLGARAPERAQATVREAGLLTIYAIGPIALMFIFFSGPYMRLFTDDPAVIMSAASVLRIGGIAEVPMALVLILMGAFQGAGDTRPLIWITLAGGLARLLAAFTFVKVLGWGLEGAWLATWCDWGLRLVLCYLRFRAGRWKEVAV